MKLKKYLKIFIFIIFITGLTNGQNFWQSVGLSPGVINDIEVKANNTVYAGISSLNSNLPFQGIVKSTDKGLTWAQIPIPYSSYTNIDFYIKSNNNLFAAGDIIHEFYRSTNDGNNWIICGNINEPKKITSSNNGNLFVSNNNGTLFKSTNEGNNWTISKQLMGNDRPYILSYNQNTGTLYISFTRFYSYGNVQLTQFFKSNDNGVNWTRIGSPLFDQILLTSIEFTSDGKIFLGSNEGIYKSEDNGSLFTLVPTILGNQNITCIDINSEDEIYFGTTSNGVFYSEDLGTNWSQINSGLSELQILSIKFDNNGYLFTGTANWGGIFRSSASTTPSVLLIQPNGGEDWQVGSQEDITWSSIGTENVKIEYSIDNGIYWNPVINSTPANSGSYTWTIPNTPSTQCKVRISDASNNTIVDESDNVFTISEAPSITVSSPIAGTFWPALSQQTVTWSSTNVLGNVNIKLSTDGSTYSITLKNNTLNDGTEEITVPDNPSSTCRIRVESFGNPNNLFGLNDGNFTITLPVDVDDILNNQPTVYALHQNFPNPFNPVTRIYYAVPTESQVTIKLFNTLGEEIQTLVDEIKSTGNYWVDLDGKQLNSGIYIYQMKAVGFQTSKKLILIK